jgi:hypothetical protein
MVTALAAYREVRDDTARSVTIAAPRDTYDAVRCEPTGTGATPSSLSGELGASAAVFNEQSQSTVASAARGCDFELFTDADTDGDGQIDTGASDVQSVEPWSGSG